jgi:aspartate beta-hydroxylase
VVFDDSFEHEAWNDHPSATRIVLIVDVWHPDLTPKETKFMAFLQASPTSMRRGHRQE